MANPEVIYANLSADNEPYVMESLCTECQQSGKTTLLLSKIPFFQEIIIMSFYCDNCGNRNSEVQFGGKIKEQAVHSTLTLNDAKDLNREIIKSEHATISIPELDFEIPSNKKGSVNTIEGLLQNCIDDLTQLQPVRRIQTPEVAQKIDEFIEKLDKLKSGQGFPFKMVVDDPSGNSYIQNLLAPQPDPQLVIKHINRTVEQLEAMGYSVENEKQEVQQQAEQKKEEQEMKQQEEEKKDQKGENQGQFISANNQNLAEQFKENIGEEAYCIEAECFNCKMMGENKACKLTIPYFKEMMLISFNCQHCGVKTNEIKSGGEITEFGRIIELKVEGVEDIKRDVFKSDTASLKIPELELELAEGTLGGRFTSVEGILEKMLENLRDNNPFMGDSVDSQFKIRMNELFEKIEKLMTGEVPFTLIMRDAVENSFIQDLYHPNPDPRLKITQFKRTKADDEYLGIDQMKTENYQ